MYRRSPLKWSIIIAVFAHPNREKRSRDHFGERSFSAIILFFSIFFRSGAIILSIILVKHFFVNKRWVFGYFQFSFSHIELAQGGDLGSSPVQVGRSHWTGALRANVTSVTVFRMNVFENSSTPPVNDHSQYSLYGSIWVVAEYYYSINYLSRPVFRTYYTTCMFALSKHLPVLCTVQYTYHGLDRWTSEINLALTKWTPCHVIFTFWKKRVSRSYCDHFSFRLFRRKPRSFVCDHFGRSFCFFHLFFSFDKRDHFSGRSF